MTSTPEQTSRPIQDPAQVRQALEALAAGGLEFPLLPEGAQALPYTALLASPGEGEGPCLVRLQRALPPKLASGSPFKITFTTDEQRYEGVLRYLGREDYLLYRFEAPRSLRLSGRRGAKRVPFRPREGATVTLWDGEKSLSGSLLNLSAGGLGFRIERAFRQDTLARLIPDTSLCQRGQPFLGRMEQVMRHPVLEFRAQVAHVREEGREIRVGLEFLSASAELVAAVEGVVALRDHPSAAAGGTRSGPLPSSGPVSEGTRPAQETEPEPPDLPTSPLLTLRRRCAPIALGLPPGELRQDLVRALMSQGFHRLRDEAEAGEALLLLVEEREEAPEALIIDPRARPTALARRLDAVLGLRT